jgi:hypothetical protein
MDVFDNLLANLIEVMPLSLSYMTKEEAHRQLVLLSGIDYGYDYDLWKSKKKEIMSKFPIKSIEEIKRKEIELRRRYREQKNNQ